jgi:excisionase family DNA binding protein
MSIAVMSMRSGSELVAFLLNSGAGSEFSATPRQSPFSDRRSVSRSNEPIGGYTEQPQGGIKTRIKRSGIPGCRCFATLFINERLAVSEPKLSFGGVEPPAGSNVAESRALLSKREAARSLGVCVRTLERLISAGSFPKPLKVGSASRFHPSDVSMYLERLMAQRRCEGGVS